MQVLHGHLGAHHTGVPCHVNMKCPQRKMKRFTGDISTCNGLKVRHLPPVRCLIGTSFIEPEPNQVATFSVS